MVALAKGGQARSDLACCRARPCTFGRRVLSRAGSALLSEKPRPPRPRRVKASLECATQQITGSPVPAVLANSKGIAYYPGEAKEEEEEKGRPIEEH